jgi:hypothetical protein
MDRKGDDCTGTVLCGTEENTQLWPRVVVVGEDGRSALILIRDEDGRSALIILIRKSRRLQLLAFSGSKYQQ